MKDAVKLKVLRKSHLGGTLAVVVLDTSRVEGGGGGGEGALLLSVSPRQLQPYWGGRGEEEKKKS